MRFSARSLPAPPNRLGQQLEQARRHQTPLLDLTSTNPTAAGFAYPLAEMQAALHAAAALPYQPEARGALAARRAIVDEFGGDPERLVLTASTSEAYALLFKLLCDPGDEVLMPTPSYPLLEFLAAYEGVRAVPYALHYDGSWSLDVEAVQQACTPRTRAIVVIHPHNPTGMTVERPQWLQLRRLGLPLIVDEVFAAYVESPAAEPIGSVAHAADEGLCFSLQGLSKYLGMPQLKLAWMALGGEPRLVEQALQRLELLADHYLSVATPVQHALPALFAAGAPVRAAIRQRLEVNARTLRATLPTASPINVLHRQGGWYAVLRLPDVRSETDWVLSLLQRQVLVYPGFFFDFSKPAYLVLSLLPVPEVWAQGVQRLAREVAIVCRS